MEEHSEWEEPEEEGGAGENASIEEDENPRGQLPCHAGGRRVPQLTITIIVTITTTTHHQGGC